MFWIAIRSAPSISPPSMNTAFVDRPGEVGTARKVGGRRDVPLFEGGVRVVARHHHGGERSSPKETRIQVRYLEERSRIAVYRSDTGELAVFEGPEARLVGTVKLAEGLAWKPYKAQVLFSPEGSTLYIHHRASRSACH